MLRILQAGLQQYVNRQLVDVQVGFRKGRGTRGQIANILWIIEKARKFQKIIYFWFIDYAKAFDSVDCNKLEISFLFFLKVLRTEEPPPTCVTAIGAQQIAPLGHTEEQPLQTPSIVPLPPACLWEVRGNNKREIVKVPPVIGARTSYLNRRSSGI